MTTDLTPSPGHSLEQLARSARGELLLVAPFIKASAIERILASANPTASIKCVTRWWPHELAGGVSDLEVWPLFRGHASRKLYLRHDLHAKLYKADQRYLVGSANLTSTALGYVTRPNLELLVNVPGTEESVIDFERELWRATVEVDDATYAAMRSVVDALPQISHDPPPLTRDLLPELGEGPDLASWLPSTRQPADLLIAYRDDVGLLSASVAKAAHQDLSMLRVPPGLNEDSVFRQVVGALLLQTPVAATVDRFVAQAERRFGEVADLLAQLTPPSSDADRNWQTLFRWFLYFTPGRFAYRRPNYSELISRA